MAEELLMTTVITFVENELSHNRVPSDFDIGDYLDHWLERYERKNGDIIDEDDFNTFLDKICEQLIENGQIYKSKDVNSYIDRVRSKNLISTQEYRMHKNSSSSSNNHRTIYRDTEFPVDDNGYYILK